MVIEKIKCWKVYKIEVELYIGLVDGIYIRV